MRIPPDAAIPRDKLTRYLLVERPWGDKSKFLARAGFTQTSSDELFVALRQLATAREAVADGGNEYGEFLRVEGDLIGPNGVTLPVVTIWLRWATDGSVRFVTLKPRREK